MRLQQLSQFKIMHHAIENWSNNCFHFQKVQSTVPVLSNETPQAHQPPSSIDEKIIHQKILGGCFTKSFSITVAVHSCVPTSSSILNQEDQIQGIFIRFLRQLFRANNSSEKVYVQFPPTQLQPRLFPQGRIMRDSHSEAE